MENRLMYLHKKKLEHLLCFLVPFPYEPLKRDLAWEVAFFMALFKLHISSRSTSRSTDKIPFGVQSRSSKQSLLQKTSDNRVIYAEYNVRSFVNNSLS